MSDPLIVKSYFTEESCHKQICDWDVSIIFLSVTGHYWRWGVYLVRTASPPSSRSSNQIFVSHFIFFICQQTQARDELIQTGMWDPSEGRVIKIMWNMQNFISYHGLVRKAVTELRALKCFASILVENECKRCFLLRRERLHKKWEPSVFK